MSQKREAARYPMRLYFDREVEEWVAQVVDLPGCIGAGDSANEAVKAATKFIPEWIELAEERGIMVSPPTEGIDASGKFVVRLPKSLHARLQDRAASEQTSLNQIAVQYLSEGLTRSETADRLMVRLEQTLSAGSYQGMVYEASLIDVANISMRGTAPPSGTHVYQFYGHQGRPEVIGEWNLGSEAEIQTADTAHWMNFPRVPQLEKGEEEQCQKQAN